MSILKYAIYKLVNYTIPYRIQNYLGEASAIRPLRDWFFRPGGFEPIKTGEIKWEDLTFYFAAPFRFFYNARQNGVENRICRLARSILHNGDKAIDVGANYGFITMVLGKSIFPSGSVLSFEIDPNICNVLKNTIEKNSLSEQITLIPKGAGLENTDKLVTVDGVVQDKELINVAFIKIDVDGADLEVLQGAYDTLKIYHPVVVVEMSKKEKEIYDLLVDLGYSHFIDQSNMPVKPPLWPLNLIASVKPIYIPHKGSFKQQSNDPREDDLR